MQKLRDTFLKGLLTLLPFVVTVYILYSGTVILENFFGNILKKFMPQTSYVPGLGFIFTIAFIYIFGLMLNNFITATFWKQVEKRVTAVPLIKAVYNPLRDLMNLFSKSGQKGLKRVVLIELQEGTKLIGLVTRDDFHDLIPVNANEPHPLAHKVAVFVPMSYGLGGYTLLIDQHKIQPLNLPTEKALQLAVTGWVTQKEEN